MCQVTCTVNSHSVSLLVIANNWENLECPSVDRKISKLVVPIQRCLLWQWKRVNCSTWDTMRETMRYGKKTISEDYLYEKQVVWELWMQTLELDWLGVEFWLLSLLDVCPYISPILSLCLSCFICQRMVAVRMDGFDMFKVHEKLCCYVHVSCSLLWVLLLFPLCCYLKWCSFIPSLPVDLI